MNITYKRLDKYGMPIFTKATRKAIYKAMIEKYSTTHNGLCNTLVDVLRDSNVEGTAQHSIVDIIDIAFSISRRKRTLIPSIVFPELSSLEPKHTGTFWWNDGTFDINIEIRINALKQAIELCNPKSKQHEKVI